MEKSEMAEAVYPATFADMVRLGLGLESM